MFVNSMLSNGSYVDGVIDVGIYKNNYVKYITIVRPQNASLGLDEYIEYYLFDIENNEYYRCDENGSFINEDSKLLKGNYTFSGKLSNSLVITPKTIKCNVSYTPVVYDGEYHDGTDDLSALTFDKLYEFEAYQIISTLLSVNKKCDVGRYLNTINELSITREERIVDGVTIPGSTQYYNADANANNKDKNYLFEYNRNVYLEIKPREIEVELVKYVAEYNGSEHFYTEPIKIYYDFSEIEALKNITISVDKPQGFRNVGKYEVNHFIFEVYDSGVLKERFNSKLYMIDEKGDIKIEDGNKKLSNYIITYLDNGYENNSVQEVIITKRPIKITFKDFANGNEDISILYDGKIHNFMSKDYVQIENLVDGYSVDYNQSYSSIYSSNPGTYLNQYVKKLNIYNGYETIYVDCSSGIDGNDSNYFVLTQELYDELMASGKCYYDETLISDNSVNITIEENTITEKIFTYDSNEINGSYVLDRYLDYMDNELIELVTTEGFINVSTHKKEDLNFIYKVVYPKGNNASYTIKYYNESGYEVNSKGELIKSGDIYNGTLPQLDKYDLIIEPYNWTLIANNLIIDAGEDLNIVNPILYRPNNNDTYEYTYEYLDLEGNLIDKPILPGMYKARITNITITNSISNRIEYYSIDHNTNTYSAYAIENGILLNDGYISNYNLDISSLVFDYEIVPKNIIIEPKTTPYDILYDGSYHYVSDLIHYNYDNINFILDSNLNVTFETDKFINYGEYPIRIKEIFNDMSSRYGFTETYYFEDNNLVKVVVNYSDGSQIEYYDYSLCMYSFNTEAIMNKVFKINQKTLDVTFINSNIPFDGKEHNGEAGLVISQKLEGYEKWEIITTVSGKNPGLYENNKLLYIKFTNEAEDVWYYKPSLDSELYKLVDGEYVKANDDEIKLYKNYDLRFTGETVRSFTISDSEIIIELQDETLYYSEMPEYKIKQYLNDGKELINGFDITVIKTNLLNFNNKDEKGIGEYEDVGEYDVYITLLKLVINDKTYYYDEFGNLVDEFGNILDQKE